MISEVGGGGGEWGGADFLGRGRDGQKLCASIAPVHYNFVQQWTRANEGANFTGGCLHVFSLPLVLLLPHHVNSPIKD